MRASQSAVVGFKDTKHNLDTWPVGGTDDHPTLDSWISKMKKVAHECKDKAYGAGTLACLLYYERFKQTPSDNWRYLLGFPDLKLTDGMRYGHDAQNKRVCLGARMGRSDVIPKDRDIPCRLRVSKLKLQDGDYDEGGAYWGYTEGTSIFCAYGVTLDDEDVQVFGRSSAKSDFRKTVQETLPNVTWLT